MRRGIGAAAAGSVLLLTGCGVQGLQWHPGVAATVGDHTITEKTVSELANDYCTGNPPQSPAPGRVYRSGVLAVLITRSAAAQVAEKYDVGADDTYRQAVAQAQSQAQGSKLTADQSAAYVEIQTFSPYVQSLAEAIGTKLLAAQGTTGATSDQAGPVGLKAIYAWIGDGHVDINPGYSIVIGKAGVQSGDTDTSYALSSQAKGGMPSGQSGFSDTYLAGLGANQLCG